MGQTLQGRAEIARIVEVPDAGKAEAGTLIWFARLVPLFDDLDPLALLLVEAQVSHLALLAAVVDLVALAVECEFLEVLTMTALCVDGQWHVQLLFCIHHVNVVAVHFQCDFVARRGLGTVG